MTEDPRLDPHMRAFNQMMDRAAQAFPPARLA